MSWEEDFGDFLEGKHTSGWMAERFDAYLTEMESRVEQDEKVRNARYRELLEKAQKQIYRDNMESLIPPEEGLQEMVRPGPVANLLNEIHDALKERELSGHR